MTAAKIFATINNSYATITSGTKKPLPFAAIVTWCPGKKYFIFNIFPFSTVLSATIVKNKPVGFYLKVNKTGHFTSACP